MTQRSIRDTAKARKPAAGTDAEAQAAPADAEAPHAAALPAAPAAAAPAAAPAQADDGEVVWELGGVPKKSAPAREAPVPLKERLLRIPPGVAVLTVAAVLSLGFLLYEIATRTASVQLLTSAGIVCGIVYVAVAFACSVATWRLGHEGRLWTALLVAFVGGCAAFVAAGSFAGALVLFLALGF